MPAPVVAATITTAGAIGTTVATIQAQKKAQASAQKAAEEARQRQERINKVNEIKQLTLDTIGDVNAPEWQEFYDFAIKHPDDPGSVKEKSDEVIKKYQERTKKELENKMSQKSLVPERQSEPIQDLTGFFRNTIELLKNTYLEIQRTKSDVSSFKREIESQIPERKEVIYKTVVPIGLIVVILVLLYFLTKKK
jgi:hypothetical protein